MSEQLQNRFPSSLYIATYDICGYDQVTSIEKPTQKTGIVTHTNELVDGFAGIDPSLQMTVSQTGSPEVPPCRLITPGGKTVYLTSIDAKYPFLDDPQTGKVLPEKVLFYYETDIYNPDNPVWQSNAEQYAADIRGVGAQDLLLQNPNPLVSVLKAEEYGYLDPAICGQLRVTSVIHDKGNDTAGYAKRFEYIRDRLGKTRMDIAFITISQELRRYLLQEGIPSESLALIPNGIDVERFDSRVSKARELGIFACVQARDNLPKDKRLVLSTGRRILWKGHQVIIEAARMLKEQGKLTDAYMAFAGKSMCDSRSQNYEKELDASIKNKGLSDTVFLLDTVNADELAACYGAAYATLLPSTRPEGFPYASLESMLAGAPVISSRLGGTLDYIVDGENGLFVEPNNPGDLAAAIDRILSSPRLHAALMRKGRNTAEEYSLGRMINGYASVITRAR